MDTAHSQETSSSDDAVLYVDELAGTDDYWLSITDAARVCRVQDVSIRRAINRKSLPVRRQRAGQNKRTRFVRASDLARAGFPIIDESAAITTEIGKVDILSIPRQQQQIVQDHQALLLSLNEMRETLATQQRTEEELLRQQEIFQVLLHTVQEEQARQLAATESRIAAELATFQRRQSETLHHLAHQQETLHFALKQEQSDALAREQQMRVDFENAHQDTLHKQAEIHFQVEDLQKTLHSLQAMFQEHQEGVRQELTALTIAQREALSAYQQTVDAAVNALAQEVQKNAQELEEQVNALEHQLDDRLINLTQTLVQTQQVTENVRQSAESHTQEVRHEFQRQDALLRRYEQLLPLLPYAGQHLAIDQDLADLEARLDAAQQQVDARIQRLLPLLDLLSEERLELLTRALTNLETLTVKKLP